MSDRLRPATRSAGTKRAPAAHYVRFTEAENHRLHTAANFKGKSIQSFLHDAALQAIGEADAERYAYEEQQERQKQNRIKQRTPGGLGIREHLQARTENAETQRPSIEPITAPIVIAAPAQAAERGPAALQRLAEYVVRGPKWNRIDRQRTAVNILTFDAESAEERNRLAKALDEQVAALEGKREPVDLFERVRRGLGMITE